MSSMAMIEKFLSRPAMALIGMSRSGKKFGNAAYRALISKGYRVYPIHPTAATIRGVKCYADFNALPERVDTALIVVPPLHAIGAIRAAAAAGVRRVWLQQGAESEDAVKECRDRGVEVISGECILMFARPRGIHKAHRWICGALGRLPA
jgi:predicted CoA-binding protein